MKAASNLVTSKLQLQLSFLFDLDPDEIVEAQSSSVLTQPIVNEEVVSQILDSDVEERIDLPLEEIVWLHSWLLESSLEVLAARGKIDEKVHVLQWIFCRDTWDKLQGTQLVRQKAAGIGFSFANCCRLEGMDPEKFRNMLLLNPKIREIMWTH